MFEMMEKDGSNKLSDNCWNKSSDSEEQGRRVASCAHRNVWQKLVVIVTMLRSASAAMRLMTASMSSSPSDMSGTIEFKGIEV